MKFMSGSAWRAAAAIFVTACASSPAFAQYGGMHSGINAADYGNTVGLGYHGPRIYGGYGGGGLNGLGFGLGYGGYGLGGLAGSGLTNPGYGGFGGIGVGGLGYNDAHLGRYNLNYYSGYGGPGSMIPHYSYSGPYATLPPNSPVPHLVGQYSSGYSSAPTTSAAPYLTNQTYEPGDGYRYPLYYNPATAGYFYYPVAR